MKRLFVVSGGQHYVNWILPLGFQLTNSLEEADCVFFSGGEDVDPSVYGEKKHFSIFSNPQRDKREKDIFKFALDKGIPMIGTCRGAQLLCALSGGILVQDQENVYLHEIETFDGEKFICNSTHHNAQYIWRMPTEDAQLLAWSKGVSDYHVGGLGEELVNNIAPENKECEIVLYPKSKALGFQPHFESLYGDSRFDKLIKWGQEQIKKFLF